MFSEPTDPQTHINKLIHKNSFFRSTGAFRPNWIPAKADSNHTFHPGLNEFKKSTRCVMICVALEIIETSSLASKTGQVIANWRIFVQVMSRVFLVRNATVKTSCIYVRLSRRSRSVSGRWSKHLGQRMNGKEAAAEEETHRTNQRTHPRVTSRCTHNTIPSLFKWTPRRANERNAADQWANM